MDKFNLTPGLKFLLDNDEINLEEVISMLPKTEKTHIIHYYHF